jgi:hypothetical protein
MRRFAQLVSWSSILVLFHLQCTLFSGTLEAQQQKATDAQVDHSKIAFNTGLEVGQKIPHFEAMDQNGRLLRFRTIRGPKGALLVFHRSADW